MTRTLRLWLATIAWLTGVSLALTGTTGWLLATLVALVLTWSVDE